LSQSTVNYIIQDKKGFMWFATFDGINKYDGYSIQTYRHIEHDKTSLSHNGSVVLFEDNDGYIWIVNNGNAGIDKFNPETDSFTRYTHDPENPRSISSNDVINVSEDKDGNIWLCTANAINLVVNKKTNGQSIAQFIRFYNTTNSIPFNMVYEDRHGNILIFADYLFHFDRKSQKIHQTSTQLVPSTITSVAEDRSGDLWIASTLDGIIRLVYNPRTNSYHRADPGKVNITPNNRNYILIDDKDRIWIATESKGLFQYIQKEDRLINYTNNEIDPKSISDNTIYSLYIDRTGILWIGTFSQGLCKYDFYKKQFHHLKSISGDDNTLSGNVISSIHSKSPGELWVGIDLEGGINRLILQDRKDPDIVHYQLSQRNNSAIGINSILCLVQRENREVWAGNASGQVIKIIPEDIGSDKQPVITRYSFLRWTFVIHEDKQETIWGGTWDAGLWRYDEELDSFTTFLNDPNNPSSICDNIIWAIGEDNSGNLWIGGHGNGLSILSTEEKNKSEPAFINYSNIENDKKSISDNTIHVLYQDQSGTMWIGTADGLNKVLRKDNNFSNIESDRQLEFSSYHVKDGLPSEAIVGILEDDHGNLWLSTSNGISKFNVSDETFINYTEDDGLQSNEFWHNAYFKDQGGRMYFGGNNGLNTFYPDSIKSNPYTPQVVFTDFKLFYKSVEISERINDDIIISKSIDKTSEIVLSHKNNIFSLEFAALQYNQPMKNKYAYMMEGFNKEWVETSADHRIASYTNLPPKKYIFKVKASNCDGLWNENSTSLNIIITPPFWQNWWFRIGLIFMMILAAAGVHFYRVRIIETQRKNLEVQVAERTAELKRSNEELEAFTYSVSHDLRAPLRGMDGFSQIVLEEYTDKLDDTFKDYLKRIQTASRRMGSLIEDLLRLFRLSRSEMNLKELDLSQLFKSVVDEYRQLDPKRKVITKIAENKRIIGDTALLRVMLYNLIDNAWKFSRDQDETKLEFGMIEKEGEPVYYVRDNGVGFDMAHSDKLFEPFERQHTGFEGIGIGLATVKRIVLRHGGRIWVESEGEGKGSTFFFTIPIKGINGNNTTD